MKLEIKNLDISYDGKQILQDINLSVSQGEFITILGPSGCGKSTILNTLAGVVNPDRGEVYVDGAQIKGITEHFAYMPQQDLLLPWNTIMQNVCIYGTIHKKEKEIREKAKSNFELFGLSGYEDKYPDELSGGMRQRAAFLRTALCSADIMLLDEPFGALDVITRGDMQEWLLEIRSQLLKTTILVTHDIDEALYLSDRILILKGTPAGFIKEISVPKHSKDRQWLFEQTQLRNEIYSLLKEQSC